MKGTKPFVCLFCSKNFRTRVVAKRHSCSQKQEAEKRMGVKLATYDPIERVIEIEREAEISKKAVRERLS